MEAPPRRIERLQQRARPRRGEARYQLFHPARAQLEVNPPSALPVIAHGPYAAVGDCFSEGKEPLAGPSTEKKRAHDVRDPRPWRGQAPYKTLGASSTSGAIRARETSDGLVRRRINFESPEKTHYVNCV